MEFIKSLWYAYKVRRYEKLIIAMTKAREGLKSKQTKFTKRQEFYRSKLKDNVSV